jgi:cytochrome b
MSDLRLTRIWDLPTRLFHWCLVLLVAAAWGTAELGDNLMDYHKLAGYGILALVMFRLAWGICGSETSRFVGFVRGPKSALAYLQAVKSGQASSYPGHNPLGGWMVAALLALLFLQAGTGLFANDDIMTEGPLKHWVSDEASSLLTGIHETNFYVLLGLVAVHVSAILFYRFFKGEDLVRPMLTGNKPLPLGTPEPKMAPIWLAALIMAGSSATVWGIVAYL